MVLGGKSPGERQKAAHHPHSLVPSVTEDGLLTLGSGILGCQTPRPSCVEHQLSPGYTPRGLPPMGTRGGPQATSRSRGLNSPPTGTSTSSLSPLVPEKLPPQGHTVKVPGICAPACISIPCLNVLRVLQVDRGAQGSYLNHKRVLPVRHLQGCGCPHVGDRRAGNAKSRPRRLRREREQDPDFWCAETSFPFPRDSSFPPHPKGVRQITLLSLSCPH